MVLSRVVSSLLLLGALAFDPAWSQDWTDKLPEGPGKQTVGEVCGGCHAFFGHIGKGYTPGGWQSVIQMMLNRGAPIPENKIDEVTQYLAKNYPERGKPKGVTIEGPTKVSFQQWQVSPPGARPHDPLAARDGSLWYTGQMANILGRIDPKTGAVKEFPLKTLHSGPHGLVEDSKGNIWYTANSAGLIGKLDPNSGEVSEYPLPDPNARDPHSLVFDPSGVLWFTVQGANMIGRLDPRSLDIKLFAVPTRQARPYGIQINSEGIPFFDEFGVNKIGRIDPKSFEIKEYELPNPGARPRRLAITSDDKIWYSDFARGYLGRLDPQTGSVQEWQSPSGQASEPYGISQISGILWYSESGSTPNTVVRFDPKNETFQSWALPNGGNIVRNTSVSPGGDLVLANSLINTITKVSIETPTN